MRFPKYVPPAIQQYITSLLDGNGKYPGWVAAAKAPGNEWIAEVVAFLKRFEKTDEVIQELFRHLDDAKLSEADQKQFMNAAWASRTDFAKYRSAVKKAAKLPKQIEAKAKELARLLDEIQKCGFQSLPLEFYDIRTLLSNTDAGGDNFVMWRQVCEESIKYDYKLSLAPLLPELLGTVAKAASNYEPSFYGRIGAAIEPRQHNPKTEFIRAFGHMLTEARIPATPAVMNAIACMTTIAIDDGDTIACYDDVKQALGLKQKPAG